MVYPVYFGKYVNAFDLYQKIKSFPKRIKSKYVKRW